MQYVKKQGNFWIKTNERTGWWIAGKRSDVFIITNGFVCQYVRKEHIIDAPVPQTEQQIASTTSEANSNPATQTQTKQISNLNQATTSTTTSNQTTSTSEANLTHQTQTKRKRGRPPAPQVICPKCGSSGIVIERLVKSYIYRCIRHKENGKIKECVIQNISKAIYR